MRRFIWDIFICTAVSSDDYHGIALSSIFGKVFDNIVLHRYHEMLCTSDLQFGFKKKSTTNLCTMVLKETISYYIHSDSSAFCTFFDASKAFDQVRYCKLFRILISRNIPACIVRVLIQMYTGQQARVSWVGVFSDYLCVLNGVKQVGVLSPVLFFVYIAELLLKLSAAGVGCYIGSTFVGALAYTDDIVLICPTPSALRLLLKLCDDFAREHDVVLNVDKSKYILKVVPLILVEGISKKLIVFHI